MTQHYGIDPRKNSSEMHSILNKNTIRIPYTKSPLNYPKNLSKITGLPETQPKKQNYQNYFHYIMKTQKAESDLFHNNPTTVRTRSEHFLNHQYQDDSPKSYKKSIQRLELIENMLINFNRFPFHTVIEQTLVQFLKASSCYLWIVNEIDGERFLTSPTLSITSNSSIGLVGLCFQTKEIITVTNPSEHPSFNASIDYADCSVVCIPLFVNSACQTQNNTIIAVAQVIRNDSWIPFEPEIDTECASFFMDKFYELSHLFYRNYQKVTELASSLNGITMVGHIEQILSDMFKCDSIEFWMLSNCAATLYKFKKTFTTDTIVRNNIFVESNSKMIFDLMQEGTSTVIDDCSNFSTYSGGENCSLLLSKVIKNVNTFSIVLKRFRVPFSQVDLNILDKLIPIISPLFFNYYINNSYAGINDEAFNDGESILQTEDQVPLSSRSARNLQYNDVEKFAQRLTALLEVAEILSGVLDIDVLIPTIMSRSCSLLKTERCTLFLVDVEKKELISRFQGGLDKSIRLPINKGIAGHTATTGEIVNITDAYQDSRFNQDVDKATGFKTRTILTVPIYNNRGEIAGVTELINRIDGSAFDDDDIKMMMAFNVFCGISLDNAKLYHSSLNLTRQLRSFVSMTTALNQTKTVRDVAEEILINAKEVIHANRATIFLVDDNGGISQFANVGKPNLFGTHFAKIVVENKQTSIFSHDDVKMNAVIIESERENDEKAEGDITANPDSGSKKLIKKIEEESQKSVASHVSSVFIQDSALFGTSNEIKEDQYSPICNFPLISNEGKIIGVMELNCSYRIMAEDVKLLDCFAVFATVSIEKGELQEIAKFGKIEQEIKKYLTYDERKRWDQIPQALQVDPNDQTIYTVNFDAPKWEGIGFFKVIYAQYYSFDLLRSFEIPNETLFRFLSEISQTYKKVPYHNWRHAVDVTEYISFELRTSHMDEQLSKFELLGLLTSAVCHDANHDGFTNVFNEKAETPLGILFKNQSVMETHHCTESITVLSKAENNLFNKLTPAEYKKMWTLIIDLILITDMAKHFDFLKSVNAELDKGPLNMEDESHRLMVMQAILKCGDISNVSRPFELANRWCDVLCEEFFRQGDLEMASGMEYTSPLNDRAHLDKPKSQIGFYTFVCLPLYEVAARAMPELICNVNQIKSNLEIWKKRAAEKAEAEKKEEK